LLINASPDLHWQIEANRELQPRSPAPRSSPIAGALLTNSDLDHVLGLFCLREGNRVNIYATSAVRRTLERHLGLSDILGAFCGVAWHEPPGDRLEALPGRETGKNLLTYRAVALPGKPPPFAKDIPLQEMHSVAYQLADAQTGGRLLVAPDVAALNDELLEALSSADAVLFDGTFWSTDELSRVKPHAPGAGEMGHVTIRDCSLGLLGRLRAKRKIYIHINNTNPILASDSRERAAVEAAGIIVGSDGFEFEL
jgi:pyrroloquinoline quinone biosynthesis protein B